MDEEKDVKKEEQGEPQPVIDAEKERDSAWDEAGKLLEGEGLSLEADKTEKMKTPEPEKKEPAEDSKEKALRDTKAWATKLAMQNAELKHAIEAFQKGQATQRDVQSAQDAVDKTNGDLDSEKQKVYEEYPELKHVLEPLFKEVSEIKSHRAQEAEKEKYQQAVEYFNANVKPEILKVHPDFEDVMLKTENGKKMPNDEYWQWVMAQSPAMRLAATESADPNDIIMAVDAYKRFKASDEARDLKDKQDKDKKTKIINAMSLRGGGSPMPAGYKRGNPDDYDSAWDEAGKLLKQQGL